MLALKRIRKLAIVATGLGFALFATQCGDDDLEFQTKVKSNNLCQEAAEVMCSNVFQCCRGAQIEYALGVEITTSEKKCRRDVELACEEQTAIVRDAVAKGRAAWKVDKINNCFKSAVAPKDGCFPVVTDFLPQCDGIMYDGLVVVGAPCVYDFECQGDGYCGVDRKCATLPLVGQSCESDRTCASASYCSYEDTDADGVSDGYICVAKKAVGVGCNSDNECAVNTICIENEIPPPAGEDREFDGLCTAKRAVGEPCNEHEVCATNNCIPSMCADGSGLCFSNDDCGGFCEGESIPCSGATDCPGTCETSGDYCSDEDPCDGTCQALGYSCSEFDACDNVCSASGYECYDESDCPDGETCDPDTCVADTCVHEACVGGSTCGNAVCGEVYNTMNYCEVDLISILLYDGSVQTDITEMDF